MRNKKHCASDSGQWRNNIKYDSKVLSKGVKRERWWQLSEVGTRIESKGDTERKRCSLGPESSGEAPGYTVRDELGSTGTV